VILHGYFRSSASWRVRIALALKGVEVEQRFHHLRKGEQSDPDYLAVNPQGLVPALVLDDAAVLTQSLAIVEYLDEIYPAPPLLPAAVLDRAHVRAMAQVIACDVHPVQNLRILDRVRALGGEGAVTDWVRGVISEGMDALEVLLARHSGHFCFGDAPGLADIVLIPQLGNVRRFGLDVHWPKIASIEAQCMELAAFRDAVPSAQPDAE
jgi:maleylpyruvate isomerase